MNILLVSDVYFPALGGTETATANQKKILERAGHRVHLVTARTKAALRDESNVTYIDGPVLLRTKTYGMVPPTKKIIRQFVELLQSKAIDIVHVTTEVGLAHAATVAAKQLRVPVVFTPHTLYWRHVDNLGLAKYGAAAYFRFVSRSLASRVTPARLPKESWAAWSVRSTVFNLAQSVDYLTPPSAHLAATIASWDVTTPMQVNQNAIVSTPHASALPAIPTLLWLGRLSAEKQPIEFLDAVLLAESQTQVQFKVLVVGSGPLEKSVAAYCKKSAAIEYRPAVQADETPALYEQSSVLCVTSNGFDNQPMVIVEALTAGRGVLYRDPNLSECFATKSGLQAGNDTVASLAAAIVQLVSTPPLVTSLAAAAVDDARRYQPEALLERLTEVYERSMKAVSETKGTSR